MTEPIVVSYIQMPEGLSPTHQSAWQYIHSPKGKAISISINKSITVRQRTPRYNDKHRLELNLKQRLRSKANGYSTSDTYGLLHLDQVRHGVN